LPGPGTDGSEGSSNGALGIVVHFNVLIADSVIVGGTRSGHSLLYLFWPVTDCASRSVSESRVATTLSHRLVTAILVWTRVALPDFEQCSLRLANSCPWLILQMLDGVGIVFSWPC
jgi:hypothetical protein